VGHGIDPKKIQRRHSRGSPGSAGIPCDEAAWGPMVAEISCECPAEIGDGGQSSAPQLMRDDAKTMESFMLRTFVLSSLVVGVGFAGIALAQQGAPAQPTSNIKRTMLQKVDVPGTDYETMTGIAEIVPNASIGRHTHPGPETGYVIEGEMTLIVDGQPAKTVKAGESYQVPPGGIHDAKSGDKGVKVMAVYVVEKGKPLASPAP